MEWNNKYNYPKSTRSIVDGSRHYSVNEERLPSVTTILKATESEEKKASLQAWKQRVGQKQAEIITREASSRGSSMHEYLEKFLLGKLNLDLLGDNTRERMMADQIIENGLRNKLDEIWGCEATLYYQSVFQILRLLFLSDYKFRLHLFELLKIEIPYEEIVSKLKEY